MSTLTCSGCKQTFEPRIFDGEIQLMCDACITAYAFQAPAFERRSLVEFLRRTSRKRRAS